MTRARRFLFTTFEGGGHVPPALIVARRLADRGHEVMVMSDEANRAAAADEGLSFRAWRTAPNRRSAGRRDDPLDDWRHIWPPAVVRAISRSVITGPALAYARDTAEAIEAFRPDALVTNELLFGAMMAAEAAGTPAAALTANVWCFPTREDVPPFGPGWGPAQSRFEEGRERQGRRWLHGLYNADLAALNDARSEMGLPDVSHVLDQLASLRLIALGTSAGFDFGRRPPPAPFLYAGRLLPDQPRELDDALASWVSEGADPLVLISFSTTFQDQTPVMSRCIRAMRGLPVRALVTTGGAVDPSDLPDVPNVRVVREAAHDALMPFVSLLISHGGHGTVIRALAAGTPVLVLPMGRDHPENARRIVERSAGLSVSARSTSARIRRAAQRLLTQPDWLNGARRLASDLAHDGRDADAALRALEALAEDGLHGQGRGAVAAHSRPKRIEVRRPGRAAHPLATYGAAHSVDRAPRTDGAPLG